MEVQQRRSPHCRRVVIAVDDSEHSEKAFNFYFDTVGSKDDYIILIHCPEQYNFVDASPMVIEDLLHRMKDKVQKLEKKYTTLLSKRGVSSGKFCTGEGHPGHFICTKARDENCDFIVTGSRGLNSFKRMVLGSVSDYVIHHATCPVLVGRDLK